MSQNDAAPPRCTYKLEIRRWVGFSGTFVQTWHSQDELFPFEVTIFLYKWIFPNRKLRLPWCFPTNVYSTGRTTPFCCGHPMALFQFVGCLLWTLHLKIKHVRAVPQSQPNVEHHATSVPQTCQPDPQHIKHHTVERNSHLLSWTRGKSWSLSSPCCLLQRLRACRPTGQVFGSCSLRFFNCYQSQIYRIKLRQKLNWGFATVCFRATL